VISDGAAVYRCDQPIFRIPGFSPGGLASDSFSKLLGTDVV